MYLNEVPKYRDTIMEQLIKCDPIVELLSANGLPIKDRKDLIYKRLFPYDHILEKTSEVGNYLCFDVVAPRVIDRAFIDFRIFFWAISHDRCISTPSGLAQDRLSIEIENIMNGSRDFGLGTVELISWDRFNPAECFHARTLVYRTVDFNRE